MCDKENICEIIISLLICLRVTSRYVVLIYSASFNYVICSPGYTCAIRI